MATAQTTDRPTILRAAGSCLIVDTRGTTLPVIVHWGADVGELSAAELATLCDAVRPGIPSNSPDRPRRVGLLPQHSTGYAGRATLEGARASGDWSPLFEGAASELSTEPDGSQQLTVTASDPGSQLGLRTEIRLSRAGVVAIRHHLTNLGDEPYSVTQLPAVLPVPRRATELLDLTGRHLRERAPQRMPLGFGAWAREQRRGRIGHDSPLVLAVGTPGFGWAHGEVWAVHVGWSGNATTFAERLPESWSGIGGAELLQAGEVTLATGAAYDAPWVYAVHSAEGLDGISAAYHELLRGRPNHPTSPRPVLLNTWEAVYFNQDLDRLKALADRAAEVGVERFVLDDGWFGGRRDDRRGLGDWVVSGEVWPDGLRPIIDHVTGRGMQFGIWVEPEMVSPDSDLARAHPEWIMGLPGREPMLSRHQLALDLAHPGAYAHVFGQLDALLTEHAIGYVKWDHNRDIVDAVHDGGDRRYPGIHGQTLATYRLLDELRARHPGVEFESCAGGGGRVDLGILARTERVWTSDCNDPLERQQIQRWTNLLVPHELMGCHIGPVRAHTTGRVSDLSFRAGTALFGHLGIEWDLTNASADDLEQLSAWVALHKELRGVLHTGRVVRGDGDDPATLLHGVVARDRSEAVYAYVQMATTADAPPPPLRLPGLDPETRYRVTSPAPGPGPRTKSVAEPPWWQAGEVVLSGAALATVGVAAPLLGPEQLAILRVQRV